MTPTTSPSEDPNWEYDTVWIHGVLPFLYRDRNFLVNRLREHQIGAIWRTQGMLQARFKEVFGRSLGHYLDEPHHENLCRVWRLDTGVSVWLSERGWTLRVPKSMTALTVQEVYEDFLSKVLCDGSLFPLPKASSGIGGFLKGLIP